MNNLSSYIRLLTIQNPHSSTLGLVRSLLALSTLLTLLFNDSESIFSSPLSTPICTSGIKQISLYCLFSEADLYIARIVSIIILVLVIVGIYPRTTGILHWWVSLSFFISTPYVDGGDQVVSILTFMLIPVTLLDNRKSHWKKQFSSRLKNLTSNVTIRIIRIQVSIIYLHAAIAKLKVNEWIDGTVIYYWFTHNTFGLNLDLRFLIIPIIENGTIIFFITWFTLILELSLFAGIFSTQRIRLILLPIGITFHILIFLIHGLGSFGLAMIAALLLYLYPMHKNLLSLCKRLNLPNSAR